MAENYRNLAFKVRLAVDMEANTVEALEAELLEVMRERYGVFALSVHFDGELVR